MHWLRTAGTVLLMLVAAGCADPGAGAPPPSHQPAPPSAQSTSALPAPPASATPSPSSRHPRPRCGRGRAVGTTVLELPGGRRALLAVPTGDDGLHRLGLVIGLPGYGRTPEELAAQSRLPARAEAAGVLAVLPQGAGPAMSWNFSNTSAYDDVGFLSALVTQLVATECADPAHVVIAGISDGGDMAAYAACALPGRFRAVVTVAASTGPGVGCRRVRIVAVHGDADPLDPYRGGPDGRPDYPQIPPAVSAIAAWASLDGCSSATTTRLAAHIVVTVYPCGAQLVTVNGGGHTWPGGVPADPSLGVTTGEYDATATILRLV